LARTYRELVAKTAELENANEELSQYAYVASHDLKTPLRAIHNYVDFLREDLEAILDDEDQMYLDSLYRAVREAEALVDDLLQLSRISQYDVSVETIDTSVFLRNLIASLDLPDDVEIVMADDWPTLEVEPVLFRQILQNLIGNAAKFNKSPHKRVELGWRFVGNEHYEFFVRDDGIGIESRYQEQIFRVFERLHTREEFEGTGIGLAIVKKAITKLGGAVRVESKPGEGSTFLLTLPRAKTTTNCEGIF
jgi:light-regulated signal transduction histidine kinase (bacteriophytochrome)